jgi:signal transduction histidine kinase
MHHQLSEIELQRQLLTASLQAELNERERIARNIHDDVGPLLNLLQMSLEEIQLGDANSKEFHSELINCTRQLIGNTIDSLKGIINDILPLTLVKLGFMKAFEEYCHQITICRNITVKLEAEGLNFQLAKSAELQLFRVVKEIMNNILKHASPSKLNVVMRFFGENYCICIFYDGNGLTTEEVEEKKKQSHGLGLKNIECRVKALNGNIGYDRLGEKRYKISIEVPDHISEIGSAA